MRTHFAGLGICLPDRVVTNAELGEQLGVSPDWIETRSGIRERRYAADNECTSDLALVASERALADANVLPEDVDLVVFATITPDYAMPGAGFFLQAKLGLGNIPVFELRDQCSGFLYGLSVADRAIRLGDHSTVLLIGAEIHSKCMDFSPKGVGVSVLFGDGAGAVVLQPGKSGVGSLELHADGRFARALWVQAPGTALGAHQLSPEHVEKGLHFPEMDGGTVFMWAIEKLTEAVQSACAAEGMLVDEVDLFVLHQANLRIIQRVSERLEVPMERFFNTLPVTGNTTAASLPIGLHEARRAGRLERGMRVVLATFGAGFTWGGTVVTW